MQKGISIFTVILFLVSHATLAQQSDTTGTDDPIDINYAVGADLSFLKMAEDSGTVFKDNGKVKPGLEIFSSHGYNWIRLRLSIRLRGYQTICNTLLNLQKKPKSTGSIFCLIIIMPTVGRIRVNNLSLRPGKDCQ